MNLFRISVGLFAISILASLAGYLVAIPSYARMPVSGPSPTQSEDHLMPASIATPDYVSAKEHEIAANAKQLAHLNHQISAAEASAPKLQLRQRFLANQIDELRLSLPGIELEIDLGEKSLQLAEQQQNSFDETVEKRKGAVVREADKRAKDQYRKEVEELALARKRRDELRLKRGARRQGQAEVQVEFDRNRRAKVGAESKYANLARIANSRIDAESARLAESVSSARDRITVAKRRREDVLAQINSSSEELVKIREETEVVPIRIARFREERESVLEHQRRSESDLRTAKSALREKQAHYIAARVASERGRVESDDQAPGLTPPLSYGASNYRVGWSPLASPQGYGQHYGGRYFDPRYRPTVGEHFVNGYVRNGRYVSGYLKTNADDSYWNNWSSRGNVNPYTGRIGTKLPRLNSYHRSSFARGYGGFSGR